MNRPFVVYNGDRPFSQLSSRVNKVRWHRATGQLISSRDLKEFGLTPFETRIDELKALQAEVFTLSLLILQPLLFLCIYTHIFVSNVFFIYLFFFRCACACNMNLQTLLAKRMFLRK